MIYGAAGISRVAIWRKSPASGQAAAKAMRTRAAVSIDAGAEFQEAQTNGGEFGGRERIGLWDGLADGEDQPISGGVQDQPHLVGARAAARGAVGSELGLVQLDQSLPRRRPGFSA